jgi:hypothetical protein
MVHAHISRILGVQQLQRVSATFRSGTIVERAALAVAGVIVVLGVWLRCRAITSPMWLDEASWAMRLINDPLRELVLRPIGFMAIERALARVFSPSEAVLRFLPWLGGVICTVMSVPLARRLFRSEASRLLFVGMIAMDPSAIELSKEFKPYSISLTIHAALMFLALRYAASGRARDLAWLLSVSLLGVLFAQDAIFAYPGIFLLLAIDTLRARRVGHFVATAIVGALTLAIIGALYVFIWSTMSQSKEETQWGKKYDVFYVSGGTKTDWALDHYAEMVQTPALRRNTWKSRRFSPRTLEELGALYGASFLVLNLAGLWQLFRGKKWRECVLVVLPLAVMLGFNLLGFWPFGPFRANLFTLVYIAALAGVAVDRHPGKVRVLDFAPVTLLIFVPLFAFEGTWHATKTKKASSRFPDAMSQLIRFYGPAKPKHRDALVGDHYTCPMYNYYTKYHPVYSKTLGPEMLRRFALSCLNERIPEMLRAARKSLRAPDDRAWILISNQAILDKLKSVPDDMQEFARSNVGGLHLIVGLERVRPKPEEGAAEP